ncbi:prominin-1-A [Periplaneta americana]|uniref:prominin-1-A n=1 Tax=Periplaneta americana TaxID=6978 RepID=UPI0037E85F3C
MSREVKAEFKNVYRQLRRTTLHVRSVGLNTFLPLYSSGAQLWGFLKGSEASERPDMSAERVLALGSPVLEFPEVPVGESFRIQDLGLSDGLFAFRYISRFLSWIQPHDFPVELLRDALWSRMTVLELIAQSLRVEAGFVACLVIGALLAVGAPCVLLTHVCCHLLQARAWTGQPGGCALTCRRCSLVFAVQLVLLLLAAGVVAMFVTNQQVARAVQHTPGVVHAALSDVTTFLRNSQQQLRFVVTKSLDRAADAASADLDDVEELLGRPIQEELAAETGVDVAMDALVDVGLAEIAAYFSLLPAEARSLSGKVDLLLASCAEARQAMAEARQSLADLRLQVEAFRRQCPSRMRPLCDTIDATGLDIVLRLDALAGDELLAALRDLRGSNLSAATQQARGEFQLIPQRMGQATRGAVAGVRGQLARRRDALHDAVWALDVVARDLSYRVESARADVLQAVDALEGIEEWRWLTGLGAALLVLLVWLLLVSGLSCGCCGSPRRAATTLLVSLVLVSLLSVVLWGVALSALLVGGHGEVFVCRPLYDEPQYSALTRLVDHPGVLFQHRGGFFSNLLYGNATLDVPVRDVLHRACKDNSSTYTAFRLQQVLDVDTATDHRRWDALHSELRGLQVDLSDLQLLTPDLQRHLQALLHATAVNLTRHRIQITGQVTGKDLSSFADQMTSVANQITDRATLSRLDTLATSTRQLVATHVQPLEQRKEDLVYQLTALEMQMMPLQRQVNQSLSHLKTIQYFINNQGSNIAYEKSANYTDRIVSYLDQYRAHVLNATQHGVAPCRPVWDLYHNMRLLFCRHGMDPLNGFWFATVWCLLLFLVATPLCLKLVGHYKQLARSGSGLLHSRSSESPSETLMISEQGAPWTTPGAPEPDGW